MEISVPKLPALLYENLVRAALAEDLGRAGDITTDAIVPASHRLSAVIGSRQDGAVAGLDIAIMAFRLLDPDIRVDVHLPDASRVKPGDAIATISGPARGILSGERVALNFLGHLSGVATATAGIADAIRPYRAKITCTRKTMPGIRALQKYAVRCGGGANHRFGLDDAVLIKDNHVAVAGGVAAAIGRARAAVGHLVKIEVEVDTLAQLEQALAAGAEAVLLDNLSLADLRRAVAMTNGRAMLEASGRITPESAPPIAETGVDLLSAGWLTHSSRVLDVGLDHVG
ncbi:MAG: carboxylating nicotinate-nucleotide diphosphorylase [Acetobacteraceae bacterium]|nr:carboxylating nicotinate-nucleotide diphosphorylase [Acetobacteraceae bacterium]